MVEDYTGKRPESRPCLLPEHKSPEFNPFNLPLSADLREHSAQKRQTSFGWPDPFRLIFHKLVETSDFPSFPPWRRQVNYWWSHGGQRSSSRVEFSVSHLAHKQQHSVVKTHGRPSEPKTAALVDPGLQQRHNKRGQEQTFHQTLFAEGGE